MTRGKDFVIYTGSAFTLEWYFNAKGKSQSLKHYEGMEKSDRRRDHYENDL